MKSNSKSVYSIQYTVYSFGQSLIEVVISSGIAVLLTVALITTSLITQKSARVAKNNAQATKLAQETTEKIRVYRDRKGFSALFNGSCLILKADSTDINMWSLTSTGCPEIVVFAPTSFERSIIIQDQSTPNNKLITVTVVWKEAGQTKTVSSQTILSQWEQ